MVGFQRRLSIALPERQSAFLWGARKTGKSTFLRAAFPGSLHFDFLRTDLLLALDNGLVSSHSLSPNPRKSLDDSVCDHVGQVGRSWR